MNWLRRNIDVSKFRGISFARGAFKVAPVAACVALALASANVVASGVHVTGACPDTLSRWSAPGTANELLQRALDRANARAAKAPVRAHVVSAPQRPASTLVVGNCADDGSPDSLRSVIAAATSGDTIDLSQLTCATITLTQGEIAVAVDDLTVHGPGTAALTIDAGGTSRVFNASGTGTLAIDQITLTRGFYTDTGVGYAGGSCVYAAGNLALTNVTVSSCTNTNANSGGAVSTKGDLTLESSTLSGNVCGGINGLGTGCGGAAVQAYGTTRVSNSTISGNAAGNPDFSDANPTIAGAIFALGPLVIENSTISGNFADFAAAVLAIRSVTLHNSTITGNSAQYFTGGIEMSTSDPTTSLDLQSSIISGNTLTICGSADLYYNPSVFVSPTITGDHNLISDADLVLPPDTLAGDALLQPLADNGGPTKTHALGKGSPAIDAGSNPDNRAFDQRGSGFARVGGASADIGAFEVQAGSDVIFENGFDLPSE
jgi:hypothetical protein